MRSDKLPVMLNQPCLSSAVEWAMPKLAYRTTNPNDPDIAQRFSDAIRTGHPVATAAILAGTSERTARRYLAQGKQADEEQGSPCLFWQMFKEA